MHISFSADAHLQKASCFRHFIFLRDEAFLGFEGSLVDGFAFHSTVARTEITFLGVVFFPTFSHPKQ